MSKRSQIIYLIEGKLIYCEETVLILSALRSLVGNIFESLLIRLHWYLISCNIA